MVIKICEIFLPQKYMKKKFVWHFVTQLRIHHTQYQIQMHMNIYKMKIMGSWIKMREKFLCVKFPSRIEGMEVEMKKKQFTKLKVKSQYNNDNNKKQKPLTEGFLLFSWQRAKCCTGGRVSKVCMRKMKSNKRKKKYPQIRFHYFSFAVFTTFTVFYG